MEDAFARKKLPYNLDAEKSVIGSMLMDRDAIVEASDMLTKEDFYYGQYGILFENMVELFKEGKAVDLVTLKNKLEENNVPDEVISAKSIAEILETVPVEYRCYCTRARVERTLLTLGREELEQIVCTGETLHVDCQFCDKIYDFTPENVQEILNRC